MKAVLKGLYSMDVADLEAFVPDDPERFAIHIAAFFGVEGTQGKEMFDLGVCTPLWLEDMTQQEGGIMIGNHLLIVLRWDFQRIKRFLERYAAECKGETWREIAESLAQLGKGEFENYKA
jgi:Immunity protein 8